MKSKFTTGIITGGILGMAIGMAVYSKMNGHPRSNMIENGKKLVRKTEDYVQSIIKK